MTSGQLHDRQLDSWKEIAAYFRRDKRTVRRWEKERGLPVHRYPGGERGRVYARAEELERWFRGVDGQVLDDIAEPGAENLQTSLESDIDSNEIARVKAPEPFVIQAAEPGFAADGTVGPASSHAKFKFKFWKLLPKAATAGICVVVGLVSAYPLRHLFNFNGVDQTSVVQGATAPRALLFHGATATKYEPDSQAVELYLKGRYYWNKRNGDNLQRALDSFTQAVVKDPNYAAAYAGMADCYLLLREYSTMPDGEAYQRSMAAAQRAIEIDDGLSEGHRALAFGAFFGRWDGVLADREFRRAIELNPNDAEAHHWYSSMLSAMQRNDEALREIDRARQLAPMSNSILADRDLILLNSAHPLVGVQGLQQLERTEPNFISPHRYLATFYFNEERYSEFLDERAKEATLIGDPFLTTTIKNAKAALAASGPNGMLKVLASADKRDMHIAAPSYDMAKTLVLLGRRDEALEQLRNAAAKRDPVIFFADTDPVLKPLRGDPRFEAIVKETGVAIAH